MFTRSGSNWTQQAKLTAPNVRNDDYFGFSVAVAGETLVTGANQVDLVRYAIDHGLLDTARE